MQGRKPNRGFTLIELLVVIAIIALLISILLPSLSSARLAARSLKTASNARSVMLGVASYLTTSRSYPPHYVYGADETTTSWNYDDQQVTNPNLSPGNVITILEATASGWSGQASNPKVTRLCWIVVGSAAPVGTALPDGGIKCS